MENEYYPENQPMKSRRREFLEFLLNLRWRNHRDLPIFKLGKLLDRTTIDLASFHHRKSLFYGGTIMNFKVLYGMN